MSNAELRTGYERNYIAPAYDALAALVFAPVGGLSRLRREALDHLGVRRDIRVLELGCGSGGVTRELVARGAEVTAVDWSEPMLRTARRRASAACFERAEITAYAPRDSFDLVLFGFVLHELDDEARARALAVARGALAAGGRIGIFDHALPAGGIAARTMSSVVHAFEPATSRAWLVTERISAELRTAGLEPGARRSLAGGMAFALTATPA